MIGNEMLVMDDKDTKKYPYSYFHRCIYFPRDILNLRRAHSNYYRWKAHFRHRSNHSGDNEMT